MPEKRNWEPNKILKKHVRQAARIWDDAGGYKNFKNSISYDVVINGKPYPPKAISSCAHELATGRSLTVSEFAGSKDGTWHRRLRTLGFTVIEKRPHMDFDAEVALALKMSARKRSIRLAAQRPKEPPQRVTTQVYRYARSSLVVAERLFRANGKCDECKKPAPFNRKKNGAPYLEVHHIQPLSKGGLDEIENTIAVCPNCHCKIHDTLGLDLSND
jgi:5-methylcytosine-specific restriction protein A